MYHFRARLRRARKFADIIWDIILRDGLCILHVILRHCLIVRDYLRFYIFALLPSIWLIFFPSPILRDDLFLLHF